MEIFLVTSIILLWVAVFLNLVLTLALVRRINRISDQSQALEGGLSPGEKAPDFSADTLDGELVTLARYTGRPITFVFVAPHCQPCHELIPTLQVLAGEPREVGAQLVLVSDGSVEETRKMSQELSNQLPVLVAPRESNPFFESFKISMTPSYCSLNEQGEVLSSGYPGKLNKHWRELTETWTKHAALVERR